MPNFDFHSTLSPVQFERLIRDILEIKFKGISFRTYATGKDQGIDIKSIDSPQKIICQTKLYQNRFSQLIASLRNEIKKIRKHKASKYIIATSCTLTNNNIQEIKELFRQNKISVQENDIWDRELLNQFLSKPPFKSVLITHFNLFVTDLSILEGSLRGIINNSILQRSVSELRNIKEEVRYYIETKTTKEALKQILDKKLIIVTGTAGCGKTTTAQIVINSLLNSIPGNIEFIKLRSITEAEDIYNPEKKQVFLFDDYWGQFTEEVHEYHAGNRSTLPDFLRRIRKSKHHYVIITSRDYIIENESIQKQYTLKELIDENRIIIQIEEFNPQEKAHIFIRHLYHSNYSRDFLTHLYVGDTLDEIVRHTNYNPRLVCEFIHKRFLEIKGANYEDRYEFYYHLKKHLDSPNLFWHNLIKSQNDSARLLLFIIVISSSNNAQEEIRATFDRCVEICRNKGLNVSVKDFKEAERLLEDGFIELIPLQKLNSWRIKFKNGSIGDAVLQYLKEEATEWMPILLQGAIFFNQLTQSFTTFSSKENTNKIILQNKDKSILIKKLSTEIWTLHEEMADLKVPNFKTSMFIERLSRVARIFDLKVDLEIREFLIEKASRIIELIVHRPDFPFDQDNTFYLSSFFKKMAPWISFNVPDFLEKYFFSIYDFEDYEKFLEFKSIYPSEFEQFLESNKKKIKAQIQSIIIDTADMTEEEDLDLLFDFTYHEILKGFKLKHSKLIEKELEHIGVKYLKKSFRPVKRKKNIRKKGKSEFWKNYNKKTKPYLKLLKHYVAEHNSINEDFPSKKLSEIQFFHQRTLDQLCLNNPYLKRNEVFSFVKALALDSYHSRKWYTESTLIKLLELHSEVRGIVDFDFSEAFQQQEKWFTLSSPYTDYLVSIYCKEEISDADYYDRVSSILDEIHPDDMDLIRYLTETDPERFRELFLIPLIKNFLSKIDFTDSKSKALSCCSQTQWCIDITFKKHRGKVIEIFNEGGSASDTYLIEIVVKFLEIEEQFGFYGDEIIDLINDLKINEPSVFDDFVFYCQKNIAPVERKHFWEDIILKEYSLDVSKELMNPNFWIIIEKCGWIEKLTNVIDRLSTYVNSWSEKAIS